MSQSNKYSWNTNNSKRFMFEGHAEEGEWRKRERESGREREKERENNSKFRAFF